MNEHLHNWYPVKLVKDGNELICQWKYFKGIPFTDPFFNETINKASSIEINVTKYKSSSDLSILTKCADTINAVEPTALIFHISRCGSTLLSQSLALSDDHIVLSEVPFIDELLRILAIDEWLVNINYQQFLKATIAIYAQKTNKNHQRLFIKTDSWHLYYLPLFRLIYPTVPFLLLYREPNRVLNSQQKKRGMHAVPGLIPDDVLGITKNTSEYVNFDAHMVDVLISYLSSIINIAENDDNAFLANYNEGIENIINKFAGIIGYELNEAYRNNINARCRYNAKFPDQPFVNETVSQETSNSNKLQSLYNELDRLKGLQVLKMSSNINC